MSRILSLLTIVVVLLGVTVGVEAAEARYRLVDLGTFGGYTKAQGLNDLDQIVGTSTDASGVEHAFLWEDGVMTPLVDGPRGHAHAWEINNDGLICGFEGYDISSPQPLVWTSPDTVTELTISSGHGQSWDLNEAGQVVGTAYLSVGARAWVWDNDTGLQYLPLPPQSQAHSINNLGQIGGAYNNGDGCIYDNGTIIDIGRAPGRTVTLALNDQGVAGGHGFSGSDSIAFIYKDGVMTLLPTLGGVDGRLRRLDERGRGVGRSETADGEIHAFLLENDKMIDLNDVVLQDGSWTLNFAKDINVNGHIAGFGTVDGVNRGFLLLPLLISVNASYVDTTFTPTGGDFGLGELEMNDLADVVVETGDGQTTYVGGSLLLRTSLMSDNSTGGLAHGVFSGGTLIVRDGDNDLLTAEVIELILTEPNGLPDLLAGQGRFEVTGGTLADDFGPLGDIVQITFHLDPGDIADFGSGFTGISGVTLTPVPEPATMLLVGTGLLAMLGSLRRRHLQAAAWVLIGSLFVAGNTVQAVPRYRLTLLPESTGSSPRSVHAINNQGQIVGVCEWRAFMWEDGTTTILADIGGNTKARDINDHGLIVGSCTTASGHARMSQWKDGVVQIFSNPDGLFTDPCAQAVNDLGQFVATIGWPPQSYFVDNGVMTSIPWLSPTAIRVEDINDRGEAVGSSHFQYPGHSTWRAFLWTKEGGTVDLGAATGEYGPSDAFAINNRGQVAGSGGNAYLLTPADQDGDGLPDTWFRDDDANGTNDLMLDLGRLPDNAACHAQSLNDAAQVVGYSGLPGYSRAFLWEDGNMCDLNDLMEPGSDWLLLTAVDINDQGWIIGQAKMVDQAVYRSFLLTPVPEPATLLLLGTGLAGMLGILRRRRRK